MTTLGRQQHRNYFEALARSGSDLDSPSGDSEPARNAGSAMRSTRSGAETPFAQSRCCSLCFSGMSCITQSIAGGTRAKAELPVKARTPGGLPLQAGGRLCCGAPDRREAGLGSGKAPLLRGTRLQAHMSCKARQRQRAAARTARVPAAPGMCGSSVISCRRLCSTAPGVPRCLARLAGQASFGPVQAVGTCPWTTQLA